MLNYRFQKLKLILSKNVVHIDKSSNLFIFNTNKNYLIIW